MCSQSSELRSVCWYCESRRNRRQVCRTRIGRQKRREALIKTSIQLTVLEFQDQNCRKFEKLSATIVLISDAHTSLKPKPPRTTASRVSVRRASLCAAMCTLNIIPEFCTGASLRNRGRIFQESQSTNLGRYAPTLAEAQGIRY